jgi:hypothetical protein
MFTSLTSYFVFACVSERLFQRIEKGKNLCRMSDASENRDGATICFLASEPCGKMQGRARNHSFNDAGYGSFVVVVASVLSILYRRVVSVFFSPKMGAFS